MPILPDNKDRYPDNWPEIRQSILERAGNCCEICGFDNGVFVQRLPDGNYCECWCDPDPSVFKIVLTVMHLDRQPENCDPSNLKAACQICHNRYDAPVRAASRKRRRRQAVEKTQSTLKFDSESAVSGSTVTISAETHLTSITRGSK